MEILKKAWRGWKVFAEHFGNFMSGIILTILYFTVMLPYGLALRLFMDPLAIKSKTQGSNWKPLSEKSPKIESYQKQY